MVTGTSIGTAWQVRIASLLAAVWLSLMGWRKPVRALVSASLAAAVALATLAWTGHGAASEGLRGWIHLVGDILRDRTITESQKQALVEIYRSFQGEQTDEQEDRSPQADSG